MDIKEYLNEKLKNNKVADKAKRIIATGLVTGTILTGAGLTACEQKTKIAKAFDENISMVEDLPKDFEFEHLSISSVKFEPATIDLLDRAEGDSELFNKSAITYEISDQEFQKIYDMASSIESEPLIEVTDLLGNFVIDIDPKAFNNEKYGELFEYILSVMQNHSGQVENFDNQQER